MEVIKSESEETKLCSLNQLLHSVYTKQVHLQRSMRLYNHKLNLINFLMQKKINIYVIFSTMLSGRIFSSVLQMKKYSVMEVERIV